jgi:hypothetical protein
MNVGVDIEFQKGVKLNNHLATSLSDFNYNSTYDEMHYKSTTITPYAIFKALSKPSYFIYNKLGILFTLPWTLHTAGKSLSQESAKWPVGPADSAASTLTARENRYEGIYKVSLGVGFNVAFGVNVRLTNKLRFFGELFGNFSALQPATSKLTSTSSYKYSYYSATDYDYTVSPPVPISYQPAGYEQYTETIVNTTYQKGGGSTNIQEESTRNPDDPSRFYVRNRVVDKRFTINMNSIGINCGVSYRF